MDDHTLPVTPYQRHRGPIIANPYETRDFNTRRRGNTHISPFYTLGQDGSNPEETTIGTSQDGKNTPERAEMDTIRHNAAITDIKVPK